MNIIIILVYLESDRLLHTKNKFMLIYHQYRQNRSLFDILKIYIYFIVRLLEMLALYMSSFYFQTGTFSPLTSQLNMALMQSLPYSAKKTSSGSDVHLLLCVNSIARTFDCFLFSMRLFQNLCFKIEKSQRGPVLSAVLSVSTTS